MAATAKRATPFYVTEHGDPDGPPLVLIHGYMAHSMAFRRVTSLLSNHRLLLADLPGHGRDETFRQHRVAPTLEALRAWILQLQEDVLGDQPAVWLGHSLGGALAYELARQRPDAVRSLILVGPALRVPAQPIFSRVLDRLPARLATLGVGRVGLSLYQPLNWRGEPMTREEEAEYLEPMRSQARMDFMLRLGARMLDGARTPITPVTPPTLLLWGEHDHMLPLKDARWIGEQLNAPVEIIRRSGHSPMEDEPEQFAEVVQQFLKPH